MMEYAFEYGLGFDCEFHKYLTLYSADKRLVKDSTIARLKKHVDSVRAQRTAIQRVLSVIPGYKV